MPHILLYFQNYELHNTVIIFFWLMEFVGFLNFEGNQVCVFFVFTFTHVIKYITYRYAIKYNPILYHWRWKSRTRQWSNHTDVQTSCGLKFWRLKNIDYCGQIIIFFVLHSLVTSNDKKKNLVWKSFTAIFLL